MRWAFKIREGRPHLKWVIVIVVGIVWLLVIPPCWFLVKLGEMAHAVSQFCGFDTLEW